MAIYRLGDHAPTIAETAFIAAEATLIGQVAIGEHANVWPGAVLRGDNEPIHIGDHSNVQEGAVLHTDPGCPLHVAKHVTIGHQAMLHGCTVGEGSLIGIQAVVLNRAVIGKHCLVGAGAVVTEGKTFADGSLILGSPGRVVRQLEPADIDRLRASAENYSQRAALYKTELQRIDR